MHIVPGKSSNLKFGFFTNKQTNKQTKKTGVCKLPTSSIALHLKAFQIFQGLWKIHRENMGKC